MRILQLSVLLAAVALPLSAVADTYTFSYVGNDFTGVYNTPSLGTPYTTSDFVTVEFTVSLPGPLTNTDLESLTPSSFSLSDGTQTLTNTTPGLIYTEFEISTNSAGAITGWDVEVEGPDGYPEISTFNTPSTVQDYAENGYDGANITSTFADNFSDPGTWTITDDTALAATPEPSSWALLVTGLLGVGGVVRRRLV